MPGATVNTPESRESKKEELFKAIGGEESIQDVTEIESYCVNCGENGTTRLLLTSIPFYKEIVIASFSCPHCNYANNEIQSAGETAKQGIKYTLEAREMDDLSRQVIKSDYASLKIPQLDLETPAKSQKGEITTVEGILQRVVNALSQDQERRKVEHPEDYERIETFISKVRSCLSLETPFTLIISDISGSSFISTPPSVLPGHKDERLHVVRFDRTAEDDHELGLFSEPPPLAEDDETKAGEDSGKDSSAAPSSSSAEGQAKTKPEGEKEDLYDEVLQFGTLCPQCGAACSTNMKLTKIPFFKEVVVMATTCEKCGNRTNEVKSGSGIEPKGKKMTLRVTTTEDLCRDVLKSETCSVEIPELELQVGAGTLGGKFTTLEGLLCNVKDQLSGDNPLISGDSAQSEMKEKMEQFCRDFDRLISCEVPFTVILDDPAGNSYLQNIYAPDDDPEMQVVEYERTFEQNEELGLNDINTELYATEAQQ